jgi:hypothetical protein
MAHYSSKSPSFYSGAASFKLLNGTAQGTFKNPLNYIFASYQHFPEQF